MPKEQPSTEDLLREIASLRQQVQDLKQDKADLEILLEMTTEHSDTVEAELHNRAVEAVRASQRKLAQFLEAMPVGVVATNIQGQPYYLNQRAKQLLNKNVAPGTVAEDVAAVYQLYQAETEQLYPSERLPGMRALQGESVHVDDLEVRQRERVIPLEVWASPIFDEQGEVTDAISAFQDISHRKQAEAERLHFTQELEAQNAALEEMNRLKDEFLANTSHELRTPLNGIIGIAQSLMDGAAGPLTQQMLANLEMIVSSGKRLATLVNNILDFSKLKHRHLDLQLKPVGIREVVDVVLALSQPLLGQKPLRLVNRISAEVPLVRVDEDRVQQILHNLVGNAVKFTHRGTVEVSAQVVETGSQNQTVGDWVAIAVTDTGIGIPEDRRDRIFESFEQVDGSTARHYGGTGLGLAIAKQLVELHGGQIGVESTVGIGSTFTFTLPRYRSEDQPGAQPKTPEGTSDGTSDTCQQIGARISTLPWNAVIAQPTSASSPSVIVSRDRTQRSDPSHPLTTNSSPNTSRVLPNRFQYPASTLTSPPESPPASLLTASHQSLSSKRGSSDRSFHILIVDDDPVNLQVLLNYLSLQDYAITQAASGPEALQALDRGLRPDLILLDVMMPQMTGYEVCQKIRGKFSANQLPIILLTAKNQVSDLTEGLAAGANDYLTKPVAKNELLARIKTHIQLTKINLAYERFVPHEFLDLLDKESIVDVQVGDQIQREMSVLFSDIRNFTTLSESMTPEDNFKFINAYLSRMEPRITEHHGFIDKYIGDAIMALYSGDADNAVKAGIAMLKTLTEYNKTRQRTDRVPIQIGIGINTGSLMLGTVGGKNRMDGTVISDAVNLAFRIEELTKLYGVSLLISHHTFLKLKNLDRYALRIIDRVKVKGKSAPVSVYEIFDADPPAVRELKLASRSEFEQALLFYNLNQFSEAIQLFETCLQQNPNDCPAQIYLDRCQHQICDRTP